MTILKEILARKAVEVRSSKARVSPSEMRTRAEAASEPTRGFRAALIRAQFPAVIAEVKRRSPSAGEIRPGFEPVSCARDYAEHGAAALSVLTDETFFGGHLDFLAKIRSEVSLPMLRKDFMIDAYQVNESRAAGADAILLIASTLSGEKMADLAAQARALTLDVLVEVHDEAELNRALTLKADLIGVNNRDLATFRSDLATTERLAAAMAEGAGCSLEDGVVLVSESGIRDRADIDRLQRAGARAFLVGESLMRQPDLGLALQELRTGKTK